MKKNETSNVQVNFPNLSRSYDEQKSRVRFWGYDNTMEISFFVELDALKQLCPDMKDAESAFLQAFDKARDRIYEVAKEIYEKNKKRSLAFVLEAKDF